MKKPQPWLGYAVNLAWPIGFLLIVAGLFTNNALPRASTVLLVAGFLLMAPAMVLPQGEGWRKYWNDHDERRRQWEAEQ